MHPDAATVWGNTFADFVKEPFLDDHVLKWRESPSESYDETVLASIDEPFAKEGGLRLMSGNLGRCIIKISAVAAEHRFVEAPIVVIEDQNDLQALFEKGELDRDCIVVVRYQGPRARGMPELHKLTPYLGTLQDRGHRVALVTDGRMSGASGKVPAAIHLVPEADEGGLLRYLEDGDMMRLNADNGELAVLGDIDLIMQRRTSGSSQHNQFGCGRELFAINRENIGNAEQGASYLFAEVK
tara:strand:- start:473 stop:1195 length:723 start_codon:yes stop_codon:yes gene_type:complete